MNEKIMVRVDKNTYEQLKMQAEKLGLKLSTYCRLVLKEKINE